MTQENIPLQPNEEIKPIQGYEGLYSITSFGRVWSHEKIRQLGNHVRRVGKLFLRSRLNKGGYPYVILYRDLKPKTYVLSKLTAQAFIPNPNNLSEVNHKDGNKQNNFAGTENKNYEDGNLEWCTRQDNMNHALIHGLKKYKKHSQFYGVTYRKRTKNSKKVWFVVLTVERRHVYLGAYYTEIEAAQAYNNYVIEHGLNRPLNNIGE